MERSVRLTDTTDQAEQNDLANSNHPERLPEVIGVLHLSNKARERDLSDKGVANVQKGVHPRHESCPRGWNDQNQRLAADVQPSSGDVIGVWIITSGTMLAFSAGKRSCEDHTDEGEQSGEGGQLGQGAESTGHGAYPTDHSTNRGEPNSTNAMA